MNLGTKLFRSVLLALAGNNVVASLLEQQGLKLGAKRFVAGETLDEAMEQTAKLNRLGISVTLDHLGEGIRDFSEAKAYKEAYLRVLRRIYEEKADAHVSLKPTQMGITLQPEAGYAHIRDIVRKAQETGSFVRIDMENSPYTDTTIQIVRRLHDEGMTAVGTVIQAYLYRSPKDVEKLTDECINLRLVKGAYQEPKTLAYPRKPDVDEQFNQLIQSRLDSGVYTAIATHDRSIIEWTKRYTADHQIPRTAFEFQMLYGVGMKLQEQLAQEEYKVRCYVPFGTKWYSYFIRRLAERPANVWFILKNW